MEETTTLTSKPTPTPPDPLHPQAPYPLTTHPTPKNEIGIWTLEGVQKEPDLAMAELQVVRAFVTNVAYL